MRLVELVPGNDTEPEVQQALESWLVEHPLPQGESG